MRILKFLLFGFLFTPFLFRLDTAQNYSRDTLIINQYIKSIGQSFTAKHNNIYLVKLFMNNSHITGSSYPLTFTLKERGKKTNLAEINFSSSNIGENYALPLQFTPIPASKDKTFLMELDTPDQSSASALEARYSIENIYQKGEGYINGKPIPGDFTFKVYYKVTPVNFISDSLHDFTSRLSQDRRFLSVYAVLIITVLGLLEVKI